jgi:hypothetical protein
VGGGALLLLSYLEHVEFIVNPPHWLAVPMNWLGSTGILRIALAGLGVAIIVINEQKRGEQRVLGALAPLRSKLAELEAGIREGREARGVLLARQRSELVQRELNSTRWDAHIPKPGEIGSEPGTDLAPPHQLYWLGADHQARCLAAYRQANILPEASRPEDRYQKRKIRRDCLKACYEAAKRELEAVSSLRDN